MIRGTFANIRLRNQLLNDVEGGFTKAFIDGDGFSVGDQTTIYDASAAYQAAGVPLVVLAGKGTARAPRDWAAKGTALLGSRRSSPSPTSGSTAPTSSAWACCRCSPQGEGPPPASA